MDSGTKVWKAYVSNGGTFAALNHWLDEGVVTALVESGVPLVRTGSVLVQLTDAWRTSKAEALRDVHRAMIRYIGQCQAKADEIADQAMHATLTTEAAA